MFQIERAGNFGPVLSSRWRDLPGGVRQSDCDGRPDPLEDASSEQLWRACDERLQFVIAERFSELRADEIRDALLEAEMSKPIGGDHAAWLASLANSVWRAWIAYRDSAVEDVYRRGQMPVR